MNALLIALVLFSSGAGRREVFTNCDMIELNHFHDSESGSHAYDQYIFYEWSPDYRRHDVVAWCLVDDTVPINRNGAWIILWRDRDFGGLVRIMRTQVFKETWTDKDPERINKKLLDEKYRVRLPSSVLVR